MSKKMLLCDFRAKIEFLALIDCLGLNYRKIMGFNFFEPLIPFWGLFKKTKPFLCLFVTVNINKAILPNKSVIFALHFTIKISFEGFIIFLKEFKVIIDEVCLINI